jgi:hypothetical protein
MTRILPRTDSPARGVIGITGVGAIQLDYVHAVFGSFPLMLAVVAVLTMLLLAVAFRSVLLPAKAVVLNLLSLAATFGAITWFWQEGHGSRAVFGIPATGAITLWRRWERASCWMRPLCARSWSRRQSRLSAGGTGGFRGRSRRSSPRGPGRFPRCRRLPTEQIANQKPFRNILTTSMSLARLVEGGGLPAAR